MVFKRNWNTVYQLHSTFRHISEQSRGGLRQKENVEIKKKQIEKCCVVTSEMVTVNKWNTSTEQSLKNKIK